ncbi:MAG: helicase-related protein, partial [Myxococcota bacterium]|nr:helicase-related protein [Myxococcota bacterium]
MLIFVRTRSATMELAEKLEARGFAASPLSGEMSQDARQRTVDRLKKGKLDVLICTDVAARGLDVERVSHVVNYDIPNGPEAYVHRIGRTGRAGREGQAILFVSRRERRLLNIIERTTRQRIEQMSIPTSAQIGQQRVTALKGVITDVMDNTRLGFFEALVDTYLEEREADPEDTTERSAASVAAAMIFLYQRDRPLVVPERSLEDGRRPPRRDSDDGGGDRGGDGGYESGDRYRLDVGREHGVEIRHIVGCITHEAGISNRYIGKVRIHDTYTTVDLPSGMPDGLFHHLSKVRLLGQQLNLKRISHTSDDAPSAPERRPESPSDPTPRPPEDKPKTKTQGKKEAKAKKRAEREAREEAEREEKADRDAEKEDREEADNEDKKKARKKEKADRDADKRAGERGLGD